MASNERPTPCAACSEGMLRTPARGVDPVADVTHRFKRVGNYFKCDLFRCPACATHWIEIYYEIEDETTMFEEFGKRTHSVCALREETVEKILRGKGRMQVDDIIGGD